MTNDTEVACDLCGSVDFKRRFVAVDLRTGIPGAHAVVTCARCGLAQLQPPPSAKDLSAAYPDWLWQDEIARGRVQPARVAHALKILAAHAPERGTLLDVGCGPGSFLAGATEAGWRARGVEASETQVAHCLARGRDAEFVPDYPDYADARHYDAITFNHVLEHVPSPRAYLARAFELLNPGGIVLVAVPNIESLSATIFTRYWTHLDVPRHLFQFSPRTLANVLRAAGGDMLALVAGDRDDNATGARDSLRRWMMHGVLRRSPKPLRAAAAQGDVAGSRQSLGRRIYRRYGEWMAGLAEAAGMADTIVAVARRK